MSMWTEVLVNGTAPAARDGHTSSVAGSKMIIFGGRGNGSESDPQVGGGAGTSLLGDEWEIDLDPSQHVTVATDTSTVSGFSVLGGVRLSGSRSTPNPRPDRFTHAGCPYLPFRAKQQAIREGGVTFIPLVVEQAPSQQDEDSDSGMCVSDMSVVVEIDHGCTGQLQLTLYGPGPPPGDTSYPENTPRAEPAVLFVGYNGTDGAYAGADGLEDGLGTAVEGGSGGGCGDGMVALFTDSADKGVWECCGKGR